MDISAITKLISVILAISLASERLITLVKTNFSWLQEPPPTVPPVNDGKEKTRRSALMIIAFIVSWVTARYSNGEHGFFETFWLGKDDTHIPVALIGLMASGGSAFWTNLLGYVSAVKDVNKQKSQQETLNTSAQLSAFKHN
ncbi:hypothetical protein LX99_00644 [Mucilaginibacter oryzae]|uniref:Uncharacterized protein n=1 Tax=Mucilaginibacter oryzae TaxID=468058 RepID=A0A316HJF9_9SPHI|nr:hypothetical protein [Mucilaginibacter oryzae]PWK80180.1 hypothetical protein LX99_00644 [Mucilaginibacter oryzae]